MDKAWGQWLDWYIHLLSERDFEPLQVDVHLASPLVVPNDPICLDSVLTALVARRVMGWRALRNDPNSMVEIPLPLAREGSVWAASAGFPEPGAAGLDFFTREGARPGLKSGPFRAFMGTIRYVSSPLVRFYAYGSYEGVEDLLMSLQYLGAHSSHGYGQVRAVQVYRVRHNWSLWREGQPMRPIPVREVENPSRFFVAITGYRPPTWLRQNQDVCVLPHPRMWQGWGVG